MVQYSCAQTEQTLLAAACRQVTQVPSLVSLPGPAEDGSVASSLIAAQEWLHSRIAYQLQQLASANVSTKVLALWLLALPFIMLAAALYQQAATVSFREAMYKV